MSKDYIPAYRVEFRDNTIVTRQAIDILYRARGHKGFTQYPLWSSWDIKRDGKPTIKNLEKWRVAMNESYARGGINYHVSQAFGFIVHIHHAVIIRQSTGEIVSSVDAPTFEVF